MLKPVAVLVARPRTLSRVRATVSVVAVRALVRIVAALRAPVSQVAVRVAAALVALAPALVLVVRLVPTLDLFTLETMLLGEAPAMRILQLLLSLSTSSEISLRDPEQLCLSKE